MTETSQKSRNFYNREYSQDHYAPSLRPGEHGMHQLLTAFVEDHDLQEKRCLEIGCGRGCFQNMVKDYTGVDISEAVQPYLHKPFHCTSATELPFEDNEFDAIWTIHVLEHVLNPEESLLEMRRVIRPGGVVFLCPAWQCRSWAAQGYPIRPYSDFGIKGKLIKASIPLRDSVWFRSLHIFPKRVLRVLRCALSSKPPPFQYKHLEPNYEQFWMSDSDAVNSMDPFEAILWFTSRGDVCLSHRSKRSQFFVRTGALVFQICKR